MHLTRSLLRLFPLLALGACDRGPVGPALISADAPVLDWHVGLGTAYEEHVHEGIQTADGGFIAVGHVGEERGQTTDILVVKTDASGAERWQRRIGTTGAFDVGIAVAAHPDGTLIAGGRAEGDRQQPFLALLSSDGETVWERVYDSPGVGALRGVEVLPDGSAIATGYTHEAEGGFLFIAEGEGLLLSVDADGAEQWRKTLPFGQGAKVRALDDGFVVASTTWTENDVQNAVLLETDREGEERWRQTYGGENTVQAFDLTLDRDGGYVLAGHTTGYGAENWDCFVIAADTDGTARWTARFGQPRGFSGRFIHDECYGVVQDSDGGFVVAGGTGDEYGYSACSDDYGCSDEWKAYLVKLTAEGDIAWQGVYGTNGAGNNAAEYMDLTEDGGYILFTDTDEHATEDSSSFGFLKLSTR